jgi:hypothetical protein
MVLREMKFGIDLQMALVTGLRVFSRVNNELFPP